MNTNLRLYGCSLFGLAQGKEEVDEEMFFVLLRRDKDEQKKKRIECNVFCQTQSKSKDKDDEMKTCMFLVWFLTRAFIENEDCAHVLCLVGSIMAGKCSSIESQEQQSANYTLALPQDINGL